MSRLNTHRASAARFISNQLRCQWVNICRDSQFILHSFPLLGEAAASNPKYGPQKESKHRSIAYCVGFGDLVSK
jgi:hypothetical protein